MSSKWYCELRQISWFSVGEMMAKFQFHLEAVQNFPLLCQIIPKGFENWRPKPQTEKAEKIPNN